MSSKLCGHNVLSSMVSKTVLCSLNDSLITCMDVRNENQGKVQRFISYLDVLRLNIETIECSVCIAGNEKDNGAPEALNVGEAPTNFLEKEPLGEEDQNSGEKSPNNLALWAGST